VCVSISSWSGKKSSGSKALSIYIYTYTHIYTVMGGKAMVRGHGEMMGEWGGNIWWDMGEYGEIWEYGNYLHIHIRIYTNIHIYTHIHTYIHGYIHIYTHTDIQWFCFFGKVWESSFQGSLYLSRESLGNHFFE
jgi:hypothetical protein